MSPIAELAFALLDTADVEKDANFITNPLRRTVGRIMTNVIAPGGHGYRTSNMDLLKQNPMKALKAIWDDKPIYGNSFPDRELPYRRMFGLPARRGLRSSYTKNGPGSFRFSDAAEARTANQYAVREMDYHPVMGHFDRTEIPGGIKYRDRWDFDLNRGERVLAYPENFVRWTLSKITKPITIEGVVKS